MRAKPRRHLPTIGFALGLRGYLDPVIVFGIFLLICAALNPRLHVLGGIGVLCIIVGLILEVLGTIGYAVGGRRHYY